MLSRMDCKIIDNSYSFPSRLGLPLTLVALRWEASAFRHITKMLVRVDQGFVDINRMALNAAINASICADP